MLKYSYTIKQRIRNRGFYCSISLGITKREDNLFSVQVSNSFKEWEGSVRFGVDYYFFRKSFIQNGLDIVLLDIHTMIVDSSPVVVFYSTVKCLEQHFNAPLAHFDFNEFGCIELYH